MRFILAILFFGFWIETNAQVTADFNLPAQVCLDEQLQLENTSVNSDRSEWHFCESDFSDETPVYTEVSNNSALVFTYGVKAYEFERDIYAFGIRNAGLLYNFEFDDTFSSVTNVSTYDVTSSYFDFPRDIGYSKVNSEYVAFVSNSRNLGITKLNFGNSPLNDPLAVNIESGTDLQKMHGLEVLKDTSLFVFAGKTNSNKIYRLQYDSTDLDTPVIDFFEVSNFNDITGISINKLGNQWYGLVSSLSSNKIALLSFGQSLSNNPSVNEINISTSISVSRILLEIDHNKAFGFVQSTDGTIVKLTFDDLSTLTFTEDVISLYSGNTVYPIGSIEVNGEKIIYHVDLPVPSRKLNKFTFKQECPLETMSSTLVNPTISFSVPGTYPITLTAYDNAGNSSSITKNITVTNNQAPDINFSVGADRCITNPIQFNSQSPATLSSYEWDFGDGNSSTAENPAHTFATAGKYAVKLSVTDVNGCTNLFTDSVEVYAEPIPDFQATAQGSICSQKPILFENLTILPTAAVFFWDFGDGNNSTEENPEHTFAEAGTYTVQQSINMAGCQVEQTKTVTVEPGPSVAFQVTNNCLGEILQFENTSTGDFLDSYLWDFGEGTQSTQANPHHLYDTAGIYTVQLTAFTTNGCDFTISQTVEIQPLAVVDFEAERACAGKPILFTELVSIETSNITDYFWDFGVAGTTSDYSTEANPVFTYEAAGTYEVRLQVTTSDGCTTSQKQSIVVNEAPQPAFTYQPSCLGSSLVFTPNSTDNSVTHFWELRNEADVLVANEQSINFSYTFQEVGDYQLLYRQENDNLCRNSITETITILPLPVVDFSVNNSCSGELLILENTTDLKGNQAKSYRWLLDGKQISTSFEPNYTIGNSGSYQLELQVETQSGCTESISKTIEVSASPQAFFELEQTVGAVPFTLSLSAGQVSPSGIKGSISPSGAKGQISPLGIKGHWTLNGDTISTTSELSYTIDKVGTYLLGLTVVNEAGCTDAYFQQIRVRKPSLDIALSNLSITQDAEYIGFIVNIANKGSLVPQKIDLDINFGDYSLTESIAESLLPEANRNVQLSVKLNEKQRKGLSKICIDATPYYGEKADVNRNNNRVCIQLENGFKVMDVFPNPAATTFTVPLIIPEAAAITLQLEQSDGSTVKVYNYNLEAGYSELQLDRENLRAGMYLLRIRYQNQEKLKKIVFQ